MWLVSIKQSNYGCEPYYSRLRLSATIDGTFLSVPPAVAAGVSDAGNPPATIGGTDKQWHSNANRFKTKNGYEWFMFIPLCGLPSLSSAARKPLASVAASPRP